MVAVMGVLCGYHGDDLAELHERFQPWARLHGVDRDRILIWSSLDRASWRQRLQFGESALLVFSVMALGYRTSHPPGSVAYQFATKTTVDKGVSTDTIVRDASGVPQPKMDAAGKPVRFHISYAERDDKGVFLAHSTAGSVVSGYSFGWIFVQATVAILILVGFESVTAMGGEAKNAKRDVPIAVLTSLLVQGAFCYLIEYFAANYFLNSGYPMTSATGSAATIGDMIYRHRKRYFRSVEWPDIHARRGLYCVFSHYWHHVLLHEHRGARYLCDG